MYGLFFILYNMKMYKVIVYLLIPSFTVGYYKSLNVLNGVARIIIVKTPPPNKVNKIKTK